MKRRLHNRIRTAAALLALLLCLNTAAGAGAGTVYGYSEGLALVTDGALWGYANTAGTVVVPIQYHSAQSFQLGLAKVEQNHRLGIIRADGATLIPTEYDTLTALDYGVYLAQKGNFWGVLSLEAFPDRAGGETRELYPFIYDDIRQEQSAGLSVLTFVKDGVRTVVPLSSLPSLLVQRAVPSARFPLLQGRLPSFADVGPRDWFSVWVNLSYNVGLMDGKGDGSFDPHGTLTVAEALKLAAYMESRFTGDDFHLRGTSAQPWYSPSVAYCTASGIIAAGEFAQYDRPVTRSEMARIFAATSLGRTMPQRNDPGRVRRSVPDVAPGDYAADAIYALYVKGVLTGSDGALHFRPQDNLTRAEAAAIVGRMARGEQRFTLWSSAVRRAPLPESTPVPLPDTTPPPVV